MRPSFFSEEFFGKGDSHSRLKNEGVFSPKTKTKTNHCVDFSFIKAPLHIHFTQKWFVSN